VTELFLIHFSVALTNKTVYCFKLVVYGYLTLVSDNESEIPSYHRLFYRTRQTNTYILQETCIVQLSPDFHEDTLVSVLKLFPTKFQQTADFFYRINTVCL